MKNLNNMDFYHMAIKSADPDACNIRHPNSTGKTARVFFADVSGQTYVYRFTNQYFVQRNHIISKLLVAHDVPVPKTTVHRYMKTMFERYQYYPGKTLRELICAGMNENDIMNIYKDAMRIQHQISKIDTSALKDTPDCYYSSIYSKRTHQQLPPVVSDISVAIIFALSRGGKMHLFHNDLNPGNILVSTDKHMSYLLDLDGISICNMPFGLTRIIQSVPNINYNELLDFYQELTHEKLPRANIQMILKMLQTAGAARHKFERILNISR